MTELAAHDFALYAIEPEPPRDPLAAATSAEHAVARHLAVVGLPVDERGQRLLRALTALDSLMQLGAGREDFAQQLAVVEGSADRIIDMVDLWTFSRPVASRDPNWKLIATETAH